MRRGRALLFFSTAMLGGCSLLTDLGGLSGGADPTTPTSEAGSARDDASTTDATNGDTNSNAVPDAGSFCSSNPGHGWCEDFDDLTTVPSFDGLEDDKSTMSIESIAASAPHSLRFRYPPGDFTSGHVLKKLTAADTITVAFDMRVDTSSSTGQVIALQIGLPRAAGTTEHYFYFESYGGPPRFLETFTPKDGQASYSGGDLTAVVTRDKFQHFEVAIDRKKSHFTVDLDGTRVADHAMLEGFPTGAMSIQLGAFGSGLGGNQPAVFYLDNVVFDTK